MVKARKSRNQLGSRSSTRGDQRIERNEDDGRYIEHYNLQLSEDRSLQLEYIERSDWEGMSDPCPTCGGTEFDHMEYEGGHYGQYQDTVIQRTDYWDQHGSLYTACKNCEEILYKNPAYDVLEAVETGEFPDFTSSYDSI